MKARRKGTDSPFVEIDRVQLEGNDILYKAELMEFQHDTLSTELKTYDQMGLESQSQDHWQDVRERAAIAAMQGLLSDSEQHGRSIEFAIWAVEYADALVEQLKRVDDENE